MLGTCLYKEFDQEDIIIDVKYINTSNSINTTTTAQREKQQQQQKTTTTIATAKKNSKKETNKTLLQL